MTKPFTVLLDLDSTVYDLLTPTLGYLNKKHSLALAPCDIKTWYWDKPLGIRAMDFWEQEGVFYNLKPFPGSIGAIKKVYDMGVRQVFFSTIVAQYAAWEKFQAVDRDFPFIGSKNTLLTGGSKDLADGDMLVDDGPHNLEAFAENKEEYAFTVLADFYGAPYCYMLNPYDVMTDWRDYPEIVEAAMYSRQGWSENVG